MKNKTVKFILQEGENAFQIMADFQRAARTQGWSKSEIDAVREEATSGDYEHLLSTYRKYQAK